jgi:hypothetical protein
MVGSSSSFREAGVKADELNRITYLLGTTTTQAIALACRVYYVDF